MGRVMPTDGARAPVVVRAARWAMLIVVEGPANEVVVTSSTDGFGRVYELPTAAPPRGPTGGSCEVSP